MAICDQCGAVGCEERYHEFLAREYVDAEYGAVHHLTVAAYMLQHPQQLSLEGWQGMRDTLRAFLVDGVPPAQHRERIRQKVDSGARAWSLRKGPGLELPKGFKWSQTILSVDASSGAHYRQDIEAWARSVLADAETL